MVGVLRGLNKNGIWAGPPAVAFCSLLVLYWARRGGELENFGILGENIGSWELDDVWTLEYIWTL